MRIYSAVLLAALVLPLLAACRGTSVGSSNPGSSFTNSVPTLPTARPTAASASGDVSTEKVSSTSHPVSIAMGGREVGNGGNTIVCPDGNGGQTFEVLDIYEARVLRHQLITLGDDQLDYRAKLKLAIERLRIPSLHRAERYLKNAESFEGEAAFVPHSNLSVISDSDQTLLPKDCALVQTVIQHEPTLPGDPRYVVSKDVWDRLDANNQAALVLHEIIYREAIGFAQTNSIASRYLNGLILSNGLSDLDPARFLETLSELKFGTGTISGAEVRLFNYEPSSQPGHRIMDFSLPILTPFYTVGNDPSDSSIKGRIYQTVLGSSVTVDGNHWVSSEGSILVSDEGKVLGGELIDGDWKEPGMDLFKLTHFLRGADGRVRKFTTAGLSHLQSTSYNLRVGPGPVTFHSESGALIYAKNAVGEITIDGKRVKVSGVNLVQNREGRLVVLTASQTTMLDIGKSKIGLFQGSVLKEESWGNQLICENCTFSSTLSGSIDADGPRSFSKLTLFSDGLPFAGILDHAAYFQVGGQSLVCDAGGQVVFVKGDSDRISSCNKIRETVLPRVGQNTHLPVVHSMDLYSGGSLSSTYLSKTTSIIAPDGQSISCGAGKIDFFEDGKLESCQVAKNTKLVYQLGNFTVPTNSSDAWTIQFYPTGALKWISLDVGSPTYFPLAEGQKVRCFDNAEFFESGAIKSCLGVLGVERATYRFRGVDISFSDETSGWAGSELVDDLYPKFYPDGYPAQLLLDRDATLSDAQGHFTLYPNHTFIKLDPQGHVTSAVKLRKFY